MAPSRLLLSAALLEVATCMPADKLPKIPQHLCCAGIGPRREDVRAILPEAFNHTAVRAVQCTAIGADDHIHRVGTACHFCLCLYDDGADLQDPNTAPCCSLTNFGSPGINQATGYTTCQKYVQTFDLETGMVRSCELRYDLYSFKSYAARVRQMWPLIALSSAMTALCM
eukprot:TRINITY_DN62440_c0_g1_i1.p1 TRINITY_DN62440_c0_g1~~TRINITY_DN62440_c0_g1_i1.p1  ORF type:complete len:170 (+),score=24.96 TRINITY_DN62440_c0_g1_i1:47-556(+)